MDEKERENKSPALYCLDIISGAGERERRNIIRALVIIVVVMSLAIATISIINRATIADLTKSLNEQNEKWIALWREYDYETETITVKGADGDTRYIGDNTNYIEGNGDITDGKDYGSQNETNAE